MSATDQRYADIKAGALGTLPDRLGELVGRTTDQSDITLLLSVADRLDALAGDFAYHFFLKDGP